MGQPETRLELAADLFLQGVGELDAPIVFQGFLAERPVPQRIVGEAVGDLIFNFIINEIDAGIIAAQQDPAFP